MILDMLLQGHGISFLYECVGEKYIKTNELVEIDIPDFSLGYEFNGLWKKGSMFQSEYRHMIDALREG